jgi:hypothetical protein
VRSGCRRQAVAAAGCQQARQAASAGREAVGGGWQQALQAACSWHPPWAERH